MIIDRSFWRQSDLINKNVMYMALKNKLDVSSILDEIEDMMKKDKRTNPEPLRDNQWAWFPVMENVMVFLSILADKLNCNIQELFIDNSELCKKYAYQLLDKIDVDEWNEGWVDAESGDTEIVIYRYDWSFLTDRKYDHDYVDTMDLVIGRQYIDGMANYYMSYGSLMVREKSRYDYLTKGAYLHEEEDGNLKEYVEKLISEHPEWAE